MKTESQWMPTRKWMVRTVIALGALATMYFATGSWDQEESIALVGLLVGAATSYLVPNSDETAPPPTTPLAK